MELIRAIYFLTLISIRLTVVPNKKKDVPQCLLAIKPSLHICYTDCSREIK